MIYVILRSRVSLTLPHLILFYCVTERYWMFYRDIFVAVVVDHDYVDDREVVLLYWPWTQKNCDGKLIVRRCTVAEEWDDSRNFIIVITCTWLLMLLGIRSPEILKLCKMLYFSDTHMVIHSIRIIPVRENVKKTVQNILCILIHFLMSSLIVIYKTICFVIGRIIYNTKYNIIL